MDEHEFTELTRCIEELVSEYEADLSIVLGGAGRQRGSIIREINNGKKAWKKSLRCVHAGCSDMSIVRSHTIQKAASLSLLAEDGHVVGPTWDENGELVVRRIGLTDASTFPGFCRTHEQLFDDYEKNRDLTETSHFVLQSYRTACREMARFDHELKLIDEFLARYEKVRNEELLKLLRIRLADSGYPNMSDEITTVSYSGDHGVDFARSIATDMRSARAAIESGIFSELKAAVAASAPVSLLILQLPVQFPVTIAGMLPFDVDDHGTRRTIYCCVNLLPSVDETKLILCAREADYAALKNFLVTCWNGMGIVGMIESWMTHGTDHWFMRPSEWDSIPQSRQRLIIDEIDKAGSTIEEFSHSILDSSRKQMIEALKDRPDPAGKEGSLKRFVEQESAKLELSCRLK